MSGLKNFFLKSGVEILEAVSIISYEWLLIIGLIGLTLSIFGWDKGKKVGLMCPAIYIVIQILAKAICHV